MKTDTNEFITIYPEFDIRLDNIICNFYITIYNLYNYNKETYNYLVKGNINYFITKNKIYYNLKKKKQLNNIINNMTKSQINENKNCPIIEKGSKALLCSNFVVYGKEIREKFKSKKIYDIPIVIDSTIGGDY